MRVAILGQVQISIERQNTLLPARTIGAISPPPPQTPTSSDVDTLPSLLAGYPIAPRTFVGRMTFGNPYLPRRVRIPNWNEDSQWKRTLRSTLISVNCYWVRIFINGLAGTPFFDGLFALKHEVDGSGRPGSRS